MINILLILLYNLPPIELLRIRNQPILRRPLLIRQNNTLDDLDALQTAALSGILELFEHGVVELLVVHHLLEMLALDAVIPSQLLECRLSGNDDGDWLRLCGVGVDANVRDDGGRAIYTLKLFAG